MQIIILVPELEKRPPKEGDYYMTELYAPDNYITRQNNNDATATRQCYVKHEVEVPEGATTLTYNFWKGVKILEAPHEIPLPQPRKKVKKWQWEIRLNTITTQTTNHFSEEGFREMMNRINTENMQWCKILDSMIEVEADQ